MNRRYLCVVLWYGAVFLWLTWAPFLPSLGQQNVLLAPSLDPVEVALNLTLLVPVGMIAGFARHGTGNDSAGSWPGIWLALLLGTLLSLVAESGQLFLPERYPSPYDLVLNVSGAVIGTRVARWLIRLGTDPDMGTMLTWSHLYLSALVYILIMASLHQGGHRLDGWAAESPVLAGREEDGSREYVGKIAGAEICAGSDAREVCAGPGADLQTRRRLASTATETQEVMLRAQVTSMSDHQTGPTRIVTFSDGILRRNATLAQDGTDLVFRLRTPLAGPNGTGVQFALPGAVPSEKPTRVLGEYRKGEVTLRADRSGTTIRQTTSYPPLLWVKIMAWEVDRYVPVQVIMALALGALVLFIPVGLLVADALPNLGGTPRLIAGFAAAAALYGLLQARLMLPFDPLWLTVAMLTTGGGMALGWPGFVRSATAADQ